MVDLGCGPGSFHYESYTCQIIGIDLTVSRRAPRAHVSFVQANSSQIPLASNSVDAVVSHHTLEHFGDFRTTLGEVNRILKDDGLIWIAIPNGYGFDDTLYRFVFSGGGHINRFSRDQLVEEVHRLTRFRLIQEVDLFSSFIYLKKPTAEEYQFYPRTARFLFHIPDGTSTTGVLVINAATRLIDKLFGSRVSQYGWGFVFAADSVSLTPLHRPYFNVCSNCGSGIPAIRLRNQGQLKQFCGVGFYRCPHCRKLNAFVAPPAGCD
ncbi:MAG: hypothetical protein AUI45_11970 [Acidobacteria bacterium 13_1_40CM_2_56_11]|nr:MAG: hypothetical protein AUI45_11970 [Acidobacteria bacterium 13_1_40CM_2_56_11]